MLIKVPTTPTTTRLGDLEPGTLFTNVTLCSGVFILGDKYQTEYPNLVWATRYVDHVTPSRTSKAGVMPTLDKDTQVTPLGRPEVVTEP